MPVPRQCDQRWRVHCQHGFKLRRRTMNTLLLPLVAAQGAWVKRRVEMLPEASGPTAGIAGICDGPRTRLLVVGESTAAGCGASTHEEAFTGEFARALSSHREAPVEWEVRGRSGATIRRVRYRMLADLSPETDVAALLIGVNDVLKRTPAEQWREDLAAVVDALAQNADRVVVAGIPQIEAFPSLPVTLGRYLAERGHTLDGVSQEVCAARSGVQWIGSRDYGPLGADFFAQDGFHPSPLGYQRWASALCEQLGTTNPRPQEAP